MRLEVSREVREWLQGPPEDLREAEHDLRAVPPLVRGALFHCQQAVEKTFKEFLTAHERPFRKTHNWGELGAMVVACEPALNDIAQRAVDLTPYAWRFRYPGISGDPTLEETQDALALAREVCDAILARLPGEVRP
jgi:HEPN domain-containing protein